MANLINLGSELLRICPTNSNKIEVSTNEGRSWMTRSNTSSYGDFQSISANGAELLATTSKGLYVSKNGGRSWMKRS